MIDEKIYPRTDSDVQLGERRIPLHYLSKENGGNGMLQSNINDLCMLASIYHENKNNWDNETKEQKRVDLRVAQAYIIRRELQQYYVFCDLIKDCESEYIEEIKADLDEWYGTIEKIIKGD